jgi:sugar transferase (PEP-CTERM/EpsH1 system associated)
VKILFLTQRLPYAPNRGDRIRAYYLMREMSRFAQVSLFSLVHDDDEAVMARSVPFASRVETCRVTSVRNLVWGALALPTRIPLTHMLLDGPGARRTLRSMVRDSRPDLVVAYCSGMARFALEQPLTGIPFVLDFVDVDSAKWQRMAAQSGVPKNWIYRREARTLGAFERRAALAARAALVVNEREAEELRALAPEANVQVLQNGIDIEAFAPRSETPSPRPPQASGPRPQATVVFCGVMDYAPNVEGVNWFAKHVWPAVRARVPAARFLIVGARPSPAIRALARQDASIVVTGAVERVQPYLWSAAAAIAPLHLAQGVQNKVLEAVAAGLPVVVTGAVAEGLPGAVAPACVVADDAASFGTAVVTLLNSRPEERRLSAGRAALESLTWSQQFSRLETIIRTGAAA